MSANDPGHINNLDQNQRESLKNLWISLINRLIEEYNLSPENLIDCIYGKELFYMFGYENPDVTLLRYLRARKWDIDQALQQLIDTLKWRIEWGVSQLVSKGESDLCYEQILKGITSFLGHDKDGRPINYVYVKDHIKGEFSHEAIEKLTVLSMEIGRKLLHNPNEFITLVFDMTGFSLKNLDYQHIKFLLNIFQNYYPETLGLGIIINVPWLFYGCWCIINRWLDPVVESKFYVIKNLDDLTKYIDVSNLPKRLNGNLPDFNYIPPTEQDQLMLSAFHDDHFGKAKAIEDYQQASRNYLCITLEWANGNDEKTLLEERKKVTNQLKDAYEQLIPYITTKTHYHRNGFIDEPIFDIAYKRIEEERNQDDIVYF